VSLTLSNFLEVSQNLAMGKQQSSYSQGGMMVEASDEANCPRFIQDQYFFKKGEPCVIEDLLKGQNSGVLKISGDITE